MSRRIPLVVLAILTAAAAIAAEGGTVPSSAGRRAFLPAVGRGRSDAEPLLTPTLGPSPTPTRTPPPGPTLPPTATPTHGPTPTPGPVFEILTAGAPDRAGPGDTVVFTVGLVNALDVPAQASLLDTVPQEMRIVRVYAAVTATVVGNAFSMQMIVPPHRAENVFVFVTVTTACDCNVVNTAAWSATWDGGSGTGTALSNPIHLVVQPDPTATSAPTLTPTGAPTLGPSPTPTSGEQP